MISLVSATAANDRLKKSIPKMHERDSEKLKDDIENFYQTLSDIHQNSSL
jgi:hypothetical protein